MIGDILVWDQVLYPNKYYRSYSITDEVESSGDRLDIRILTKL
jgi:hypothetical protein